MPAAVYIKDGKVLEQEPEKVLPSDVICFKRTEILKYLLTCNPKKRKDPELGKYIDIIKEAYPVADYVETVFKDFHRIIVTIQTAGISA